MILKIFYICTSPLHLLNITDKHETIILTYAFVTLAESYGFNAFDIIFNIS
jgi:hypothetical protein